MLSGLWCQGGGFIKTRPKHAQIGAWGAAEPANLREFLRGILLKRERHALFSEFPRLGSGLQCVMALFAVIVALF